MAIGSHKIDIQLEPNPQYFNRESLHNEGVSFEDLSKKEYKLEEYQIEKLIISKSYETHITELEIHLNYISYHILNYITSGKFLLKITVSEYRGNIKANPITNYFQCVKNISQENARSDIEFINARLKLHSITLIRMKLENNFTYDLFDEEIDTPFNFFSNIFQNKYINYYSGKSNNASDSSSPFNFLWKNVNTLMVQEIPTQYLFKSESNFQLIDDFLKDYPLFMTDYGWMLDDFSVSRKNISSEIKINNLHTTTLFKIDENFSSLIDFSDNKKYTDHTKNAAFNILNIDLLKTTPKYNFTKFNVKERWPLIHTIDPYTNETKMPDVYNSTYSKVNILANDVNTVNTYVKDNPRINVFHTYLKPTTVAKRQLFKRKYELKYPFYKKYTISNHFLSMVELETCIKYRNDESNKNDNGLGYRVGVPYQILHKFMRKNVDKDFIITDEILNHAEKSDIFLNKFYYVLSTEIDYLTTDEVKKTEENDYYTITENVGSDASSDLAAYIAAASSYGQLGSSESGTVGTTASVNENAVDFNITGGSIVEIATKYIQKGFRYLWGGNSDDAMDCSGFSTKVITKAAKLKPYGSANDKKTFPRTASWQYNWCKNFAKPVAKDDLAGGDILFLKSRSGKIYHVGIMKSSSHVYESSGAGSKCVGSYSRAQSSGKCKGATTTKFSNSKWDGSKFAGAFRIASTASTSTTTDETSHEKYGELLNQIAFGEGTTDAAAAKKKYSSGYDVTLSYGAYIDDKTKKITTMTLGEVKNLQSKMLSNPKNRFNSSATGRYQIVKSTLVELQTTLGLTESTLYNKDTQDKMAIKLLERRGIKKYIDESLTKSKFQQNLSKEWDSIAYDKRNYTYSSLRSGKYKTAKTSHTKINAVLDNLKA